MANRVVLPGMFDLARNQDKFLLTETLDKLNKGIEGNLADIETIQANDTGRNVRPDPVRAFPMPSGTVTPIFQENPLVPGVFFAVDQYSALQFGPVGGLLTVDKDAAQCETITLGFLSPPTAAADSTGDYVAQIALPSQAALVFGGPTPTGIHPVLLELVSAIPSGWQAFSTTAIRIYYALDFTNYGPTGTASTLTVTLRVRNPTNNAVLASKAEVYNTGPLGAARDLLVPYTPIALTAKQIKASWRVGVPLKFELEFLVDAEHGPATGRIDIGRLEVNWL